MAPVREEAVVISCDEEEADFSIGVDREFPGIAKFSESFHFKYGTPAERDANEHSRDAAMFNRLNGSSSSVPCPTICFQFTKVRILGEKVEITVHFCMKGEDGPVVERDYLFDLDELPVHIDEKEMKLTVSKVDRPSP